MKRRLLYNQRSRSLVDGRENAALTHEEVKLLSDELRVLLLVLLPVHDGK